MSSRGTTSSDGSAGSNASNVDEAFELIERGLGLLTAAPSGPWWQLGSDQLAAAAVRLYAIESRAVFAQVGAPLARIDNGDPGGVDVSPLTAQTLACDSETIPILLDDDGRVLDVGTTTYPFPPRIRRAIEHRDRHCTFPSCSALPSWCHAHHLIRFPDGPTSEANGTLLCGRHHRFVHAHGWIGRLEDGHVVWRARGPDDPDPATNAHLEVYERELHRLTQRWLRRREALDDTG